MNQKIALAESVIASSFRSNRFVAVTRLPPGGVKVREDLPLGDLVQLCHAVVNHTECTVPNGMHPGPADCTKEPCP